MTIKSNYSKKTSIKEYTEHRSALSINKEHMKTHIKATLDDGTVILDEDGHSLVGNFAKMLHGFMGGQSQNYADEYLPFTYLEKRTLKITKLMRNSQWYVAIVGVYADYLAINYANTAFILVGTDLHSDLTVPLTTFYQQSDPTSGGTGYWRLFLNLPWDAAYDGDIDKEVTVYFRSKPGLITRMSLGYTAPRPATFFLCLGDGDAVVDIGDTFFHPVNRSHSSTPVVTNDPGIDEAYLTQTIGFVNNTAADIVTKEIAWLMRNINNYSYNNSYIEGVLLARDKFSAPITIPVARTLSVSYTVKTTTIKHVAGQPNDDSGITQNLLLALAFINGMSSASRYVITTDNANVSANINEGYLRQFLSVCSGGWSAQPRGYKETVTSENNLTYLPGLILCSEINDSMDVTNYAASFPIPNGVETYEQGGSTKGKLVYRESWVEPLVLGANYVSFDIVRLVENLSGQTVSVRGIALYAQVRNDDSYNFVTSAMMLAQANLLPADQFDIAPGQMAKVYYTIKVEV